MGMSGIDLVLPAIPHLPSALGGSIEAAQLVIASFVAGSGVGMLAAGTLAARFDRSWVLILSLASFALVSLLCSTAESTSMLIFLRFLQGVTSAAPAVLAPGTIRALFSEEGTMRALGALGSIESLVPGLAPIAGAWLFVQYGWGASFTVTAALTTALVICLFLVRKTLPQIPAHARSGSYLSLIKNPVYLRYSLSQAMVVGGLLVFVFGAPTVIIRTMGGTLTDFIIMQAVGVAFFIVSANLSGKLATHFGAERTILFGSGLATFGALALLVYALTGINDPFWLVFIFPMMNTGLGIRGPVGFLRAILAARGDDDRGSSLLIVALTATSGGGTALLAPFITLGLPALTLATFGIQAFALALLIVLPRLDDNASLT